MKIMSLKPQVIPAIWLIETGYSVCGGTATPNQDIYTSGIYQLPTASTSQQIKFCLNDDSFQEGPETAYVAITAPSPYGSTLQRLAEITIADNEASK